MKPMVRPLSTHEAYKQGGTITAWVKIPKMRYKRWAKFNCDHFDLPIRIYNTKEE